MIMQFFDLFFMATKLIFQSKNLLILIILFSVPFALFISLDFKGDALLYLLFYIILIFGQLTIIGTAYDALSQEKKSIFNIMLSVLKKFTQGFIAITIFNAIMIIGSLNILLIIPVFYLGIKLFFVEYAIMLNNKGIISGFKDSWSITNNNWWGLLFIIFAFSILFSLSLTIINLLLVYFIIEATIIKIIILSIVRVFFITLFISALTIFYSGFIDVSKKETIKSQDYNN